MNPIQSVLIALPTVSRSIKIATTIAVAQTVKALEKRGITAELHNIDSAEIVTARDMFANIILHSGKWDALLFIDSDMGFSPELILKMLARRSHVVAAACPRRSLNLPALIKGAQRHGDLEKARAEASDFTVVFDWASGRRLPTEFSEGFCRADAVGMAIALISRAALSDMVAAKVVQPRLDLTASDGATCYSFFGILENEGRRLGEDYSFCYRWTKLMGRELQVCVDEEVSHVGEFDFKARFSSLLD